MSIAAVGGAIATKVLVEVVTDLVAKQLEHLGQKYGTMKGKSGNSWLPYHNRTHTEDVLLASQQIGQRLVRGKKIAPRDLQLLRLAAAFHDDEQDLGKVAPGANEFASATIAAKTMQRYPEIFSADDIKRVERAIMATRVKFENGQMVQIVDRSDVLGLALADADLAHLGRDIGLHRSMMFDKEMQYRAGAWNGDSATDPNPAATEQNLQSSVALLGYHEYFLPQSRTLYSAGQVQNRALHVDIIDQLKRGAVTYKEIASFGRAPDTLFLSA